MRTILLGFFQQGRPESMPRLCGFLFCLAAIAAALMGRGADVVGVLAVGGCGSLLARNRGAVAPSAGSGTASEGGAS